MQVGSIHSFRHLVAVLERSPDGKGGIIIHRLGKEGPEK